MEEHRINLTESDFIRGRRLSPAESINMMCDSTRVVRDADIEKLIKPFENDCQCDFYISNPDVVKVPKEIQSSRSVKNEEN